MERHSIERRLHVQGNKFYEATGNRGDFNRYALKYLGPSSIAKLREVLDYLDEVWDVTAMIEHMDVFPTYNLILILDQ